MSVYEWIDSGGACTHANINTENENPDRHNEGDKNVKEKLQ